MRLQVTSVLLVAVAVVAVGLYFGWKPIEERWAWKHRVIPTAAESAWADAAITANYERKQGRLNRDYDDHLAGRRRQPTIKMEATEGLKDLVDFSCGSPFGTVVKCLVMPDWRVTYDGGRFAATASKWDGEHWVDLAGVFVLAPPRVVTAAEIQITVPPETEWVKVSYR